MQRRLLRVSGPAVGEMFITIGGIMAFSIIGLQLGTVSFAAQNVVGPIMSLAYMPSLGLGVAASTAVGQSLGARDPQLAHRYGREAAIAGTPGLHAGGRGRVPVSARADGGLHHGSGGAGRGRAAGANHRDVHARRGGWQPSCPALCAAPVTRAPCC